MTQLYVSPDQCVARPDLYKYCTQNICVARQLKCPCQYGAEFRCRNGDCIRSRQVCDGTRDCSRGEDEASCPGRETTPTPPSPKSNLPLVVSVVSVCLFVCVVALIVLCVFLLKRRRNNTSTESQSATEPLKNRYPTQYTEISGDTNEVTKKPRATVAYNNKYDLVTDRDGSETVCGEGRSQEEYLQKEQTMNINNTQRKKRGMVKPVGIYDLDLYGQKVSNYKVCGKGGYTFKPREGKSSQIYVTQTDPEMLKVVHSYKHGRGQMSIPSDLDLHVDTGQFSDTFATELLCASTPRQTVRNLVRVEIDFIDDNALDDNDQSKSNECVLSTNVDVTRCDRVPENRLVTG